MKPLQLKSLSKYLLATFVVFNSHSLFANQGNTYSIYYTYEANGQDYLAGVGTGITIKDSTTNLGASFNTTINYAEIIDERGYLHDYVNWEGSVKLGLFSQFSVYAEAGVDLSEVIFEDWRYDDYDHHHYHTQYDDDLDRYFGFGAGTHFGHFSLEAFTRVREIDSRYWEAVSEVFTGVRFSVNF